MDYGLWTIDDGRWTVDYGPFHGHAINLFRTLHIKHTPFLAVYFLFLQLRHAIVFFFLILVTSVVGISLPSIFCNLDFDWPRSLFIDLQDMYQIKEIEPFKHYRLHLAKEDYFLLSD